jgi:V-type H+-transporting ATPase subunit a
MKPPTFFELNALTSPFQQIVDTYGIPRYKEINPALFTVISFPFFFGLMFGDVGHGFIVLLLGIILLATVKDKNSPLYHLKYLIFLNGIFATYCGFIYSEWFANAFAFLPSCYDIESKTFAKKSPDCVYPFGLDYIWYISENETAFLNSFKMKFSIIIGVIQMLFGTILKAMNGAYFGKWEDVIFEAIPQFLFMFVTFGYMSAAIIIKWLTNWDGRESVSIIQVFINFMGVKEPLFGDGSVQDTMQKVFLIICVVCFIMMLFFKPFIVYFREKKKNKKLEKDYKMNHGSDDSNSHEKILSENIKNFILIFYF